MKNIPKSTYKELEFDKVTNQISNYLHNSESEVIIPFNSENDIKEELKAVSEYQSSFENDNKIVFENFDTIDEELKRMEIEDYVLSVESFNKIKKLAQAYFKLNKSIVKFKEYYPTLFQLVSSAEVEKNIIKKIDQVFTKYGEVKSSASSELQSIRTEIHKEQKNYQENFNKSLVHYHKAGILNEIQESEIDGNRVLAVNATFKNRVKGTVRGSSKTGSIIFIEPESVRKSGKQLQILREDEKNEIRKILQKLTYEISEYKPFLKEYQKLLLEFDRIQAKAQYANEIHATLPRLSDKKEIHLIDAYHPILLTTAHNVKEVIPQNIDLNENQRIIAISGPNAGGKSITLKTVGLLQLMIQNGILVPANPKSTMSFFKSILTDIGDNQSIENHLSTYSSRLQRMSKILPKADENTLILIDEFGTGSDPELGGALAETMLEYLYTKKSFCVVTTHYSNIKLRVESLDNAINASMIFDKESLSPLYKLELGQPGSSFTFEVAEKNKIPKKLIETAKGKLVKESKNLEETLVRIQQEKFEVEQLKNQLENTASKSNQKKLNIENAEQKLLDKLSDFRSLYAEEQKTLQLGNKLEKWIEQYSNGTSKKRLIQEITKVLEQEKVKAYQSPRDQATKIKTKKTKQKLKKDLDKKEEKIKENVTEQKKKQQIIFKPGMRVKIKGSSNAGTIEKIEKERAIINYGNFLTNISIFELEKI